MMMLKKIGLLGVLLPALMILTAGLGSGGAAVQMRPDISEYNIVPPYVAGSAPPLVMLILARDHSLFHLAYNDTTDIDGDGKLEIGFNPSIAYYGLFDSYKCYKMSTVNRASTFVPTRETSQSGSFGSNPKKPNQNEVDPGRLGYCGGSGEWSGNFLNYLTTNRMDALRKVLYGGKRVVDTKKSGSTPSVTVLESDGSKTGDAHNWGKEVYSDEAWPDYSPYYDITRYAPLKKPRNSTNKYTAASAKARNAPAKHFFGIYSYYKGDGGNKGVSTLGVLTQQEVQSSPPYGDQSATPTEPLIFNWMLSEGPLPRPRGELKYDDTGGSFTEYPIRVEVCKEGLIGQEKCKVYPLGSTKPIGILQKYGDDKQMLFGLISGSYQRNLSGGVLRKNIGPMNNEIDVRGHGTVLPNFAGIIKTVDTIQISGWDHSKTMYLQSSEDDCGYLAFRSPKEGECRSWGNPIGEMMFEAIRYFNGQSGPVYGFGTSTHSVEKQLPHPDWANPYNLADLGGYDDCVQPYIMVISDVNVTFDDDQAPGSKFAVSNAPSSPSFKRINGGLQETINTADLLEAITEHENYYEDEDGNPIKYFIGQTTPNNYDTTCTAKALSRAAGGLAGVRGLCPGEPTRHGSYTAAAMAYFANTHNMYSGRGANGETVDVPNATTFAVALASPLPVIEVPVKGHPISLVPYGKTYFGNASGFGSHAATAISYYEKGFQPTNTIVNMFIKQWDADDKGQPFAGAFDINFEFLEQGGNYDMDAIVRYSFSLIRTQCPGSTSECTARKVVDKNGHIGAKNGVYYKVADKNEMDADDVVGIWLHLRSYYAASYGQQNMGYIISGTTSDGPYLVVADYDTTSKQGKTYHLNRPDVCTGFDDTSIACRGTATTSSNYPSGYVGVKFYGGDGSPYLESTRFFKPNLTGGSSAAKLLPNPLWLAAKYGGFTDLNGNGLPDDPQMGRSSEWDADNDGNPDTYFYVVNPSKMEEQIDKAFSAILQRAAQGAASAISNNTLTGEGSSYKPLFYPLQTSTSSSGDLELRWGGYLQALFIDKNGFYREDTVKNTVAPYNPIMDPDDLIVTFSSTPDGSVDIRFWYDPDFTGILNNEVTSRRTGDFQEINYLWEAGHVLSGAADGLTPSATTTGKRPSFTGVDPQQRYLFTHTDLNDDGLVVGGAALPGGAETPMFDSANAATRSALGPYLRASALKVIGSGARTIMFMAKDESPSGGSISVSIQNDSSISGNVSVSVSGNAITIKKKSNTVTAKEVVDAVNHNSASYQLIKAMLATADKSGDWNAPLLSRANLSYDEGVRLLMEHTIGNQVSSWRNRLFRVNNKDVTWRFGDPMHSGPIVVAAPNKNYDNKYRDLSYRAYKRAQANRRNVVFIGTNDGFMHAVNSGFPSTTADGRFTYLPQLTTETAWPLGMEIWAYIPQAVLPHLRWLIADTNFHTYMVDLTPKVIDIKTAAGEWKTLLVCGLRLGGKAIDVSESFSLSGSQPRKIIRSEVFALDVTDLENPPKLLWSYTSERLGMSTSRPSWLRVKDKWYVIFGSGPGNELGTAAYSGLSNQKAQIILLEAETGLLKNIWEVAEDGSFLSEPTVLAATERSVDIATGNVEWTNPMAFFGLTYSGDGYRLSRGGVYQLAVNGLEDISAWSLKPVITGLGAVSSAPAAFFNCANRLWLYFGTGRYWNFNDSNSCSDMCGHLNNNSTVAEKAACTQCREENLNYFVGIRRNGLEDETAITNPEIQLIDVGEVQVSGDGTVATYNVGGSTYSEAQYRAERESRFASGIYGYRIPLRDENEIMLNQPLTVSDGNCGCLLFFTSYVPPQTICSYNGTAYLYVVDCFLGTATSKSQKFTGRDNDGVYNNRFNIGVGMPLQPRLVAVGDNLFLKYGDVPGGENSEFVGKRDSLSSGAKAWREEQRGFGEDFEITTPDL